MTQQVHSPAILLMGATASGKTQLALQLAAALDAEIVSVDSALVYRGMDIGTAKPDAAERAQAVHHLIDVVDPAEAYSAARFREDALAAIADIRARGRRPLLVGGTLLYFRALTEGLSELPTADPTIRARLLAEANTQGWPALHARLASLDPESGARLHPNDSQRIQRALEVVELSGQPMSALWRRTNVDPRLGPYLKIALEITPRSVLHERIAARFASMMQAGFLEEVRRLHARGDLHTELPSIRAVGYRQLWAYLQGDCGLDTAVQRGIEATRQLAKRQLTWLRSESDVFRLDPRADDGLARALHHIRCGSATDAC